MERLRIFRIADVNQIAAAFQKTPLVHRDVSGHLLHPAFIGMPGDARDHDTTTFDVDEKQDVIGQQTKASHRCPPDLVGFSDIHLPE